MNRQQFCCRILFVVILMLTGTGIGMATDLEQTILAANEMIEGRQWDKAEQALREALEVARGSRDAGEHVAAIWSNLSHLYRLSGQLEDAEESALQALGLYRERGMAGGEANVLAALGAIAQDSGDYWKAEKRYREAVLVTEKAHGEKSIELVAPLRELASLELARRNFSRAEAVLERVLEIQADRPGSNTGATLSHLGLIRQQIGDPEGAERLYRRALKLEGPDQGEARAATLLNLATLQASQEDWKGAIKSSREALAIWRETFGDRHPTYATGLANLGSFYYQTGQYEEAVHTIQRALQISSSLLGDQHPEVARIMVNYAVALRGVDRNRDAKRVRRQARAILERHADENLLGATVHVSDLRARER